MKTYTESIFI